MKKITPILFFIALIITTLSFGQNKKAYAEFDGPIQQKIVLKDMESVIYKVKFKSKKLATVYIELRRAGKLYAGGAYTGKAKKEQIVELKLDKYHKGNWIAAKDYKIKLYCFEGTRHTFQNKIGESTEIKGIRVTRLLN